MKKLSVILLLLSTISYSQVFLSTGVDIRNSTIDSSPTKGEGKLDLLLKFHLISNHFEVSGSYENFKAIGFERYSFGVGYLVHISDKVTITSSVEPTLIGRKKTELNTDWHNKSSHLAIGGTLSIKVDITETIGVGISSNGLLRTDLKANYPEINKKTPLVFSNFLTIYIKVFDPKKYQI